MSSRPSFEPVPRSRFGLPQQSSCAAEYLCTQDWTDKSMRCSRDSSHVKSLVPINNERRLRCRRSDLCRERTACSPPHQHQGRRFSASAWTAVVHRVHGIEDHYETDPSNCAHRITQIPYCLLIISIHSNAVDECL